MCTLLGVFFWFVFLHEQENERPSSKENGLRRHLSSHLIRHGFAVPPSPSVTPQKYEPWAMDFWLVERIHASEASRKKGRL